MTGRSKKSGRKGEDVRGRSGRLFIIMLLLASVLIFALPVSAQGETVELVLGGDGSIPFRIGDVKPGFQGDGYSDVTNNGTMDCALFIWVDNITGSYDLGKYMYFTVSGPGLTTNVDLPATVYEFPESPDDTKFIAISPMRAGEMVRLYWTWSFKETYQPQNEAQGKSLAFEILYTLQCPPPCLPPVADFTAEPRNGTFPLTVQFTDRSQNNPTSWLWEFGDGTTSTQQNPVHTYQISGTYSVRLTVRSECGSDSEQKPQYITVSPCGPLPVADFTADKTQGVAPLTVRFTDLSTGSPTSWSWDFGDGTTSTLQNPVHTYQNPGTYTVTLTVRNVCGFSDPATKLNYISVSGTCPPPVAQFSANSTLGTVPFTVQFVDQSTGNPTSWLWDFGDGTTSTLQNPVHIYRIPGAYSVSLTVRNSCGSDTERKEDYICCVQPSPPVAEFCATITLGPAPLTVQFYDLSAGNPTSWFWDFGDGTTSTLQNPVHTYQNPGVYTVTLTISNEFGSDTEHKPNHITVTGCVPLPHADFTVNNTQGPAPFTVQFSDSSTGNPTYWFWDFGDGTNSTLQNPVHIYPTPGAYSVSLSVFNSCGCDQERKENYICVRPGIPASVPVADFQANTTSGFVPLTVQFSDRSDGNATSWFWDFGDGSTSAEQNPVHTYRIPGTYTVTQTVANDLGTDSERKESYIWVRPLAPGFPPVAEFQANTTFGTAPLMVRFSDVSSGDPVSWMWNFGDGTTSNEQNPVHTYHVSGNYTVRLTVANTEGSDTVEKQAYIRVTGPVSPSIPSADFSANRTSGTFPLTVQFYDLSTGNPTDWLWDFGDGTYSYERNPVHIFSSPGTYTITLTVNNSFGMDQKIKADFISVTVTPFVVDFTAEPVRGYGPLVVRFTDLSSGNPTAWFWTFGDGATSDEQNPTHRYLPGIFTVSLKATYPNGSATTAKPGFIIVYGGGGTGPGGGGGGGGGYTSSVPQTTQVPSPVPTVTAVPISCDLPVDTDNRAIRPFQVSSLDGIATLSIESGTRMTCDNESLECIFLVIVTPDTLAPLTNTREYVFTGYAYAIRPDCMRLDQEAMLAITITTNDWEILGDRDLSLWWYDSTKEEWRMLPTRVDRQIRVAETSVTSGGTYILLRSVEPGPVITPAAPPLLPQPLGDHRIIMLLSLVLLSGALVLRFGGRSRKDVSDGALILWISGTILMILGILYQVFLVTGASGSHFASLHSLPGVFPVILIIAGLGLWIKHRFEKEIRPSDMLDWLLVIGVVACYLTILLALIAG